MKIFFVFLPILFITYQSVGQLDAQKRKALLGAQLYGSTTMITYRGSFRLNEKYYLEFSGGIKNNSTDDIATTNSHFGVEILGYYPFAKDHHGMVLGTGYILSDLYHRLPIRVGYVYFFRKIPIFFWDPYLVQY